MLPPAWKHRIGIGGMCRLVDALEDTGLSRSPCRHIGMRHRNTGSLINAKPMLLDDLSSKICVPWDEELVYKTGLGPGGLTQFEA
jgi:hypothetical protein